jgi:chromosome segregation and condensation protein ScpB
MVSVVVAQMEESLLVNARMSQTLNVLSAVAYSQPVALQAALDQQSSVEAEAISVRPFASST